MSARLACAAIVAATLAAPRAARAGNGVDLLRFMPEDSSVFGVIDISGARDSELFKKGLGKLVALEPAAFAAARTAGVDPAVALDTIAFGGAYVTSGDNDDLFVVAEGKQVALLAELIATSGDWKPSSSRGAKYWINGKTACAAIQKRLFCTRPSRIQVAIDLALGKARSASKSNKAAPLRAAIAATDTRHDVWAAIEITPTISKQLGASAVDLQGISLGATLSTDIAFEIKLVNGSEQGATAMLAQFEQALPQFTSGLGGLGLTAAAKSVQLDRDGAIVHGAITITAAELETLATLLGGAFGGLGLP